MFQDGTVAVLPHWHVVSRSSSCPCSPTPVTQNDPAWLKTVLPVPTADLPSAACIGMSKNQRCPTPASQGAVATAPPLPVRSPLCGRTCPLKSLCLPPFSSTFSRKCRWFLHTPLLAHTQPLPAVWPFKSVDRLALTFFTRSSKLDWFPVN